MIPRQMLYHPGDKEGPLERMRRNLRRCVLLCNPGDNSPPRLKCQKVSPGCGFSVGSVVSYIVYGTRARARALCWYHRP